jgi:hypothetical protein
MRKVAYFLAYSHAISVNNLPHHSLHRPQISRHLIQCRAGAVSFDSLINRAVAAADDLVDAVIGAIAYGDDF